MREALTACAVALLACPPAARAEGLAGRFERRLGFLLELRAQPPVPEDELARAVAAELGAGRADALLLGESHSDPAEFAAARRLFAAALGSRRRAAALLEESSLSNSFARDPLLAQAGVAHIVFGNVVAPQAELRDARAAAPGGFLMSYTGHAHASERLRDFWLKDLELERIDGWPRRRRVLTTVAEAVRAAGGKPLVVAMIRESGPLETAQRLFLRELPGKRGRRPGGLAAELGELIELWRGRFARLPARPAALYFARDRERAGTWYGLTPSDAVPDALLAARVTLASPEAAAFARGGRIVAVEAAREDAEGGSGIRVGLTAEDGRALSRFVSLATEESRS